MIVHLLVAHCRVVTVLPLMATVGRMVFPDFDVCFWEERAEFRLVHL